MRERRFKPLHQVNRSIKVRGPSQLSDLDGSRRPGPIVQQGHPSKAPKLRFQVGNVFEFDGDQWQILYIYRLQDNPQVWIHCLEEIKTQTPVPSLGGHSLCGVFETLGAGATTPRLVYEPFRSWHDANDFFRDIYRAGSSCSKTTQQLLALKKIG